MVGGGAQIYEKLRSEYETKRKGPKMSPTTTWKNVLSYIKGAQLWRKNKCDTTKLLKNEANTTDTTKSIVLRTYRPIRSRIAATKEEVDAKFVVNFYRNRSGRQFAKDTLEQIHDSNVNRDDEEIECTNVDKLSVRRRRKEKNNNKIDRVNRRTTMEAFERLENCDGENVLRKLKEMGVKWSSRNSCSKESGYNTEEEVSDAKKAVDKLKEEAEVQCKIMKQATKAIELCRGDPSKFRVRVEAERILLISTCKYERIIKDIASSHYETPNKPTCHATLVLSNLRVNLLGSTPSPSWFLCTLSNLDTFHASKVVSYAPGATTVEFKEDFVFEGLHPGFHINVQLYAMPEEKSKTRTLCRKSGKCKFLEHSSFEVDLESCSRSSCDSGALVFVAKVTEVNIEQRKSGFVTLRMDTKTCSWSRRWCTLEGAKFCYWSYPGQEDVVPPEGSLYLEDLIEEVAATKRSQCSRNRTLMLRTSKGDIFLNFDTTPEMKEWMEKLNEVYNVLKSWNMLRNDLQ